MTTNLQILKQKRLKWVEANRENGFDEGINRLLTELYPDNAHFIYELLQNAEDPMATEASFNLTDLAVEFEHNGEGLFTLKDIESITSIGNSNKRDDATGIGKFGVGFKAVFAYTNTPEIHSGNFHFRIHDLVVPKTEGVEQAQADPEQTRFLFPFDNPKKPASTAMQEIAKGLRALGDNTLLFLSHIRKIVYTLPDGSTGSLERINHDNGRIEIRTSRPYSEAAVSYWLHFHKDVEVTDDDGKSKTCRVAIAYSLVEEINKKTEETTWKIAPLSHGQVSIYFPAEKETSNLRFHLHAPFASTVARDSVRDCKANHQLRDCIAELIVESLSAIRDQGLLTVSFLAVLPNPGDNLAGNAPFYEPIRKAIIQAFKKDALTPMKLIGHHAAAEDIYKGPASISDIIDDEDLVLLLDDNHEIPMWVSNPPQRNQREDRFLESLDIKEWGWGELVNSISWLYDNEEQKRIEAWISEKDDGWLMRFYALLGEACSANKQTISVDNIKIIKVTTKQGDGFVIPSQAYFPSTEGITAPSDTLIVKDSVYAIGRSDEQKRLSKLFLEKSGVLPFDTKQIINLKLAEYKKQPDQVPDAYLDDIKMFVEYWNKNPFSNIDTFKNKIFLRGKSRDGKIRWCKPHELYIDKPFDNTGLKDLFNQETLKLENYKSEILEDYQAIPHFKNFAVALEVMDRIEIVEYLATKMQKDYFLIVGRKTDTTIDKDYFINSITGGWQRKGLNYIGNLPILSKNKAISYAIWKTICRAKPEQFIARYIPNQANQHFAKSTSAYFIKKLMSHAWIPDCDGNFLKPSELTLETLHPDFAYDNQNGLLTALSFGTAQCQRKNEEFQRDFKAILEGFPSHEIKMQCAELIKTGFNPKSLLEKYRPIEFPENPVLNSDRRRKGVLERSENAPSKESVSRERSIQPNIGNVLAEAKAYLRAKYTNANGETVCQCCQNEMPFKIDEAYYFEAVQCIKKVENHHTENRLALCPTCAAMYQHVRQTGDIEVRRLIVEHEAPDNAPSLEIPVTLAGKQYNLRFVGTHRFDLKTVLENL